MAPRKKSKPRPKRKRDEEPTVVEPSAPKSTALDDASTKSSALDDARKQSTPGECQSLMLYRGEPVPLEQCSYFAAEKTCDDCDVAGDEDCDEIGYEAAGEEDSEDEDGNQDDLNKEVGVGDNRIVPLAWAVVEIENDDNWDWFMKLLSSTLGLQDGKDMAVISDKQLVSMCYF